MPVSSIFMYPNEQSSVLYTVSTEQWAKAESSKRAGARGRSGEGAAGTLDGRLHFCHV